MRLLVAYGIYSELERNDNDYQVLLSYAPEVLKNYEAVLTADNIHASGPAFCENKYFVYTGNTNFGIQNLEYDSYTGDIFASVYTGKKPQFPNYDMFVIKGRQTPELKELTGYRGEQGFYFSENHDTKQYHESNICLYRYTGECPAGFEKL